MEEEGVRVVPPLLLCVNTPVVEGVPVPPTPSPPIEGVIQGEGVGDTVPVAGTTLADKRWVSVLGGDFDPPIEAVIAEELEGGEEGVVVGAGEEEREGTTEGEGVGKGEEEGVNTQGVGVMEEVWDTDSVVECEPE